MTREEFLEVGTDVFSEYLPKLKASERKAFLEAFLDELVARDEISVEGEEDETGADGSLFDDYDGD